MRIEHNDNCRGKFYDMIAKGNKQCNVVLDPQALMNLEVIKAKYGFKDTQAIRYALAVAVIKERKEG